MPILSEKTRGNGSAKERLRSERNVTDIGRARLAQAGKANISVHNAKVKLGIHSWLSGGPLPLEIDRTARHFRADLIQQIGGKPTAAETALIESATVSYTVVLLALNQLQLRPAKVMRPEGLSRTLAAYQASLLRSLKALGLKQRQPPARSLQDEIAEFQREKANAEVSDDH